MVLMIGAINCFAAEDDPDTVSAQTGPQSGAVIIEYREQSADLNAAADGAKNSTATAAERSSVELIVGGQAEDGVAKHKEIPVRK